MPWVRFLYLPKVSNLYGVCASLYVFRKLLQTSNVQSSSHLPTVSQLLSLIGHEAYSKLLHNNCAYNRRRIKAGYALVLDIDQFNIVVDENLLHAPFQPWPFHLLANFLGHFFTSITGAKSTSVISFPLFLKLIVTAGWLVFMLSLYNWKTDIWAVMRQEEGKRRLKSPRQKHKTPLLEEILLVVVKGILTKRCTKTAFFGGILVPLEPQPLCWKISSTPGFEYRGSKQKPTFSQ